MTGVRPENPLSELFPWYDPEALTGLPASYGFTVSVHDQTLAFTAASPEAYADAELTNPPAVGRGA